MRVALRCCCSFASVCFRIPLPAASPQCVPCECRFCFSHSLPRLNPPPAQWRPRRRRPRPRRRRPRRRSRRPRSELDRRANPTPPDRALSIGVGTVAFTERRNALTPQSTAAARKLKPHANVVQQLCAQEILATSSRMPGGARFGQSSLCSCLWAHPRPSSSSCFGLVPEVGISRHECTQKQILCRVQSCRSCLAKVDGRWWPCHRQLLAGVVCFAQHKKTRGVPGTGRDSACLRLAQRADPPNAWLYPS